MTNKQKSALAMGECFGYSTACATRGQVAQSVEQGIENPRVGGSIPSLATTAPM